MGGVHTPEFSFEKERANVQNAVRTLKVGYPVAIDSDYRVWEAFGNEYWPALYFIDAKGHIRRDGSSRSCLWAAARGWDSRRIPAASHDLALCRK